jgi:hypothetical protein
MCLLALLFLLSNVDVEKEALAGTFVQQSFVQLLG